MGTFSRVNSSVAASIAVVALALAGVAFVDTDDQRSSPGVAEASMKHETTPTVEHPAPAAAVDAHAAPATPAPATPLMQTQADFDLVGASIGTYDR